MPIKRYNSLGNNYCKKKRVIERPKKGKKQYSYKKFYLGILFFVLLFISINIIFKSSFFSLNITGDKNQNHLLQLDSATVAEDHSSVKSIAGDYEDEIEINTLLKGLPEIAVKIEQDVLGDEQVEDKESRLKFNLDYLGEIVTISGQLKYGETLYEYLVNNNISPSEILSLQEKVQPVVDISRLNVGAEFSVHCNCEGEIIQFDYQPNNLDAYYIKIPRNETDNIKVIKDDIFSEIVCIEGEITTSLYQAMSDYCQSGQLAFKLADIFAWEIDFLTECQPGDTFRILVEKLYRGDFYRWGDVLAAIYEGEKLSTHTAILFEDSSGNVEYYDENGRSLKRAFLRAPLNYRYISSPYTENRYHPILRVWRPHLAIDYAAPTGTPVVSVGAGTVISKYYDAGGYGNYVRVQHPNGYITGYAHFSRFAEGLYEGKRVQQGEIIGYVGATGLATGPHLCFSISKDGQRFNFLDLEMPPSTTIKKDYRTEFDMVKLNYLSILR